MNTKLVSIIILSYNNLLYYKECIKSILEQDYSSIEIIILDDCSKDFQEYSIRKFVQENNSGNIKKIVVKRNEANKGIVKTYNLALHEISGEYIFYLAMDDLLYDKYVIQNIVSYFEANQEVDIATGYRDVYCQDIATYIKTLPRNNEVEILKGSTTEEMYEKLCLGNFIAGCCTPFRRGLIEKWGYLDEEYFCLEDYPRYLNLLQKGYKIGFIDQKLIKYRLGGITTQGEVGEALRKDLYLVAEKEKKNYIMNKYNDSILKRARLVGWGTGDCYKECRDKYKIQVEYLIDSNPIIQGQTIEGVRIEKPRVLDKEKNEKELGILVFSYANYFDIARELENIGYKSNVDFIVCTPEILRVLETTER